MLELVLFEILQSLRPSLREFIWRIILSSLCVLLNFAIPATFAVSIARLLQLPYSLSVLFSVLFVFLLQFAMWTIDSVMPHDNDSIFNSATSNIGDKVDSLVNLAEFSQLSKSQQVYLREIYSSQGNHHQSEAFQKDYLSRAVDVVLLYLSSLVQFMLSPVLDVRQSVAHIAVVGMAIAAVVSGFATVIFPLEQVGSTSSWHEELRY